MSTTTPSQTLLQFLRNEIRTIENTQPPETEPCQPVATDAPNAAPLRVPIELGGSLWSAEVEHVDTRRLRLIVDRQAIECPEDRMEAAIHYQPENESMRCTCGTVTSEDFLPHNRIRLNFDLR